ncbi:ABC transporter permease [Pelomonas sp. APW6]|uniref:ABC transporter permease n=1 Tax=Roseateles subflavus TaxID=3053353 RepID=A0ABT7LP72_9BURK|nr:ABC transporter permease [Pelomonas sp. APW6]MDL5034655.1 ABC transporter permease [Pelomonas sp. APW6]
MNPTLSSTHASTPLIEAPGTDPHGPGPHALWGARFYLLQECLRSALASIRAHGMRSFLTMLGIIIGVASVVTVISLVQGLSKSISQQFQGLGGNVLTLRADTPIEDALRGKVNRLKLSDLEQLRHRIDGIQDITPTVVAGGRTGADIRNGSHVAYGTMYGTTALYQDVQALYPLHGRFLTESDNLTRRRVVVLGEKLRRDLKLPPNPVGMHIQIAGEWFKVVGVMEPRGEMFGISQDAYLLMPFQTALAVNGVVEEPDLSISFTVSDPDQAAAIQARVVELMRLAHGLKPGQANDFALESADSLRKSFSEISTTITIVVGAVVGISLIVGGVGIMNIMLVSVTERTREIGIAKALGAPRAFILLQFLIEAMLLAVIGGLIGLLIGTGLAHVIAALIPNFPPPTVPWWASLGACGFSGLIGVVFGILPASNAANLTPIDALRHE